jgi:hypothetical protein
MKPAMLSQKLLLRCTRPTRLRFTKPSITTSENVSTSPQFTVRAISKVAEAYKRDKSIKPEFRPDGAIVYDQRILTWKGLEAVSLTTLAGRQLVPVRIGDYQKARMDRVRGQADLILVKGIFYLCVVVEVAEETPYDRDHSRQ